MNEYQKNKDHLFNLIIGLQSFYETSKDDPKAIIMLKERIEAKIKKLFELVDEKK